MRSLSLLTAAVAATILVPLLGGCTYEEHHPRYEREVRRYDVYRPVYAEPEVVRYRYYDGPYYDHDRRYFRYGHDDRIDRDDRRDGRRFD